MNDRTLGAVLAGGRSRRLGVDKSSTLIGGRSLLERAVAVLDGVFSRVVVSVGGEAVGEDREVIVDRRPGLGPLAALESVLESALGSSVFVLACDLPLVDEPVVRQIVEVAAETVRRDDARAWVAQAGGQMQPLCGLYSAACLNPVRANLDCGHLSMMQLLERIEVERVEVSGMGGDRLLNINRPLDLRRAREALGDG